METTLQRFKQYLKNMNDYQRVCTLLSWDLYTGVPKAGYQEMADTLTRFTTDSFALSTSDELYALLDELSRPEQYGELDEVWQYSVRTMKRELDEKRRVPKEFFSAYTAEKSASMQAWQEAKRAADFSLFAPHLEKLIDMTIRLCGYTHPGREVYDVLLDQYEEGVNAADIDKVFAELKEGLLPVLREILEKPKPRTTITSRTYDVDDQRRLQDFLLDYIGFDLEAGATACSEHPFTTGFSRRDVRITNHYHEEDPLSAIFSAIHEGGHGIFEQNVDPACSGTPADDCRYMGVHESQSRFYENVLGRNENFWKPIYGRVQEILPDLDGIPLEEFCAACRDVKPSMIRTEADEVTYAFHIILRYEMEQAMFRDHVPVSELPRLWNEKMEQYLGIVPANDAEGILQDMHWSDGDFGYFPSYLLGSIYDGMFLEALEQELGSVDEILAQGRIREITRWLNEKIHRYGNLRLPKEVISQVCGRELTAKPLLDYFKKRYL